MRAEQSRAEQSRAEQSRAEQSRAEQSRAEQSRAEQSRYLYAVKAVAALLVVVLHLKVNSVLLNGISRCAVLTFFMISGYYTSIDSQDIRNILVKRIEKLLKVLLCASSVYLLKDLVFLVIHHQSVSLYLVEEFSTYRILKMLIFDDSLIRLHLWFIVAMVYLYFVLILSDKYGLMNRIIQF